ncbi:hypothetical protein [Cupriavidus sp.]|jgi:hypothetical protein|uniref:hypothetical protein n=2 Tax=Cupriavidus sp. TaxID=1873897 RepID=UPI0025C369C0|nr:hypothetical protein [Cupriavidus sp.]MCA3184727.1 hypothetical protein [Cupriavidus sp.]MCA3193068.1 hypothetical protein [Cupriavidus sp.]MCA3195920.1 hypothetical protein [Cupriavidus sp.]MCA3204821.1 hypothetical protein [Cupriavidus sp.]MCA3206974.1 hypothetical protein [Cupriavidus sp.]
MKSMRITVPAMLAIFLCAGCADLLPQKTDRSPPLAGPQVNADTKYPPSPQSRATPIPAREINMAGTCRRTEEDGFREDAVVRVSHNAVQTLTWKLWVSRKGSCHFDLEEFKQVQQTPHIELHAIDGSGCKLMVWQDPRRITLAHARCEKHCTPGIYEQAWPVLFDPRNGDCAQIR